MTSSELDRLVNATLVASYQTIEAPEWLLRLVEQGLGSVLLSSWNIDSPSQLAATTARLRTLSPNLLVSIDEEGGDVTRLDHAAGSPYPGAAALGAIDDPELTEAVHRAMGADLAEVGVNFDFAPSVDVNSAAENPVIGTRSFGADPELVARHGVAAVRGLQSAGIAACVKHFPGHGAAVNDSHHLVPVLDLPLDLLTERDLLPFRAALEAEVQAVMSAHVVIPALTGSVPATMSRAAMHDLLRGELGFTGVAVTDAVDMGAIAGTVGIAEGAIRALAAGVDLICIGPSKGADVVLPVQAAIVAAVREGRLPESRLVEAGERIAALASWIRRAPRAALDGEVGLVAARRAVRLDGDRPSLVRPLVVRLEQDFNLAVSPGMPWGLVTALQARQPAVEELAVSGYDGGIGPLLEAAAGRTLIVVARDAHRYPWQQKLVSELATHRPDAVLVEMGLPLWRPDGIATYVATYGVGQSNAAAAVELLTGG
ncbi:MAG: hypothetical protein L0Y54_17275 [Sporichthyaceae bacterium]|nr:hypothetical protein [Sporichthyaceae bacterium]